MKSPWCDFALSALETTKDTPPWGDAQAVTVAPLALITKALVSRKIFLQLSDTVGLNAGSKLHVIPFRAFSAPEQLTSDPGAMPQAVTSRAVGA